MCGLIICMRINSNTSHEILIWLELITLTLKNSYRFTNILCLIQFSRLNNSKRRVTSKYLKLNWSNIGGHTVYYVCKSDWWRIWTLLKGKTFGVRRRKIFICPSHTKLSPCLKQNDPPPLNNWSVEKLVQLQRLENIQLYCLCKISLPEALLSHVSDPRTRSNDSWTSQNANRRSNFLYPK